MRVSSHVLVGIKMRVPVSFCVNKLKRLAQNGNLIPPSTKWWKISVMHGLSLARSAGVDLHQHDVIICIDSDGKVQWPDAWPSFNIKQNGYLHRETIEKSMLLSVVCSISCAYYFHHQHVVIIKSYLTARFSDLHSIYCWHHIVGYEVVYSTS